MKWLQRQKGGDGSTNIQAQVAQFGVSYVNAKNIAMDVFNENFSKLSHEAHRVAFERAEEFVANYLNELHSRSPKAIENIEDPGVQSDVLKAQSGYAKSGDQDLGEVLVDILVDRTSRRDRNITSLSLGRSLDVAQNLTTEQFAALSAMFVFKQLKVLNARNQHQLYERLATYLQPLHQPMQRLGPSDVEYLAALGCITISIGEITIPQTLASEYPGFFSKVLDLSQNPYIGDLVDTPLITNNLRDNTGLQINAVDEPTLISQLNKLGLSDRQDQIINVMKSNLMSSEEILAELGEIGPEVAGVIGAYNELGLPNCRNTSIGTAIGHANLRRVADGTFTTGVEVWIS